MTDMCGRWPDEALLDALPDRLPEGFAEHAAGCAACAARARDLRAWAALRGPERRTPSPRTDEAVLQIIREEEARRSAPAKRSTTRRIRLRRFQARRDRGLHVLGAAAAAVLFALLIGYALQRPSPARRQPPPAVVRTPDAPPRPAPEPPAPLPPIEPPKDLPVPPTPPTAPGIKLPETFIPPAAPPAEPAKPAPAPTIVEATPPPAPLPEFARVVRFTGRAERGGALLKKGDVLLAGQEVACRTGTLLLELPDDSLVALRAGTALTAAIDVPGVTLRLSEGEVACSVRKRPERRFAVETSHGAAVVRGTVFSVRTQTAGAAVVVARGRVNAHTPAGAVDVAAGERTQLSKGGMPSRPEAVGADRLLAWAAEAGLRVIGPLWIPGATADLQAPMARARFEGALAEPLFGAVDARTLKTWNGRYLAKDGDEGGTATFTIDLPEDGAWLLWGRMFSPGTGTQIFRQDGEVRENDPNSFYVSVDGGREAVFGNHKHDPDTRQSGYRRWHWAGDGAVEVGTPVPLKLGRLAKGRHTLRLRVRDAVETTALRLAPRLDVLCLTLDPDYRPRDEDYRKP